MLKRRVRCRIAVGVAVACVLGFSGVAVAGGLAPQLRSPLRGKAVRAGHVKLTVYVPDPANVIDGHIFLTISNRRIVKGGTLRWSKHCGFRCHIAIMKRVGHSHLYTYVDPYHFPGNWQDTPGRYYWQVDYYPKGAPVFGVLASGIGSFRIVG